MVSDNNATMKDKELHFNEHLSLWSDSKNENIKMNIEETMKVSQHEQ